MLGVLFYVLRLHLREKSVNFFRMVDQNVEHNILIPCLPIPYFCQVGKHT
jgi:hypothetical protein